MNALISLLVLAATTLGVVRAQQPIPFVIDPAAMGSMTLVSGDSVHVFTLSSATPPITLRHNRSLDSGKTWLPAPIPIATNVTGMDGVVDGSRVVVSLATANGHALLRSLDGGSTWLAPTTIHVQHAGEQAPRLLLVQGVLIAAWAEPRVGPGDIYANRSFDLGATWSPTDTRLDVGAVDQVSWMQFLTGDAQAVYAVYLDGATGPGSSFLTKTLDLGATWDATARFVTNGYVGPAASGPVLLADFGGAIQRSSDYGATWTVLPFPQGSEFAISGSNAVVAIGGSSNGFTPMHSLDAGATWLPAGPPLRSGILSLRMTPFILGTSWCLVDTFWFSCCLINNVRCHVTDDQGATWRSGPYSYSDYQRPSALANGMFFTIGSFGSGPVQGMVYRGFHPYGPATPGTANISPTLHRTGTPGLGQTVTVSIEDALGGSLALIGASFAGPATQPIGSATILLAPPVFPTWLVTSGTTGAPGVGQASMQFTVPNSMAFFGFHINLQGFVLDAGSSAGFSATSGLEMVIR